MTDRARSAPLRVRDNGAVTRSHPGDGLTDQEVRDLQDALDDEYKARATYAQVIADHGQVQPFVNIVESEQRHIEALLGLFERHGIDVPPDPWSGRAPRFSTREAACRAGVEAEVENAALYDRLLAGTTRPDVLEVYGNLRRASQERHLPAFRRCAEGSAGAGRQRGRRRRGGRGPR